jgi:cephalosporin hydroxylase
MPDPRVFAGGEYLDALRTHYPDFGTDVANLFGFVGEWSKIRNRLGKDDEDRFLQPEVHGFDSLQDVWELSTKGDPRWISACSSYKGLILGKTPFDLMLYSNLIWELQPKTVLEFGALQGGSALWFVDQLQALCGEGEVHSFELLTKCIHPRARHPRLSFHAVDLRDRATLDGTVLSRCPHPWLVVDDAHCNLDEVVPLVSGYMSPGDYYVIEDVFVGATDETSESAVALMKRCGLVVDIKYTDAFGRNVTCSPNAWLVKT